MERQLLTSDSNYFEHAIITTAENELRMNDAFELCILLQGECHVRSYEKDILIKENDIFFFPSQGPTPSNVMETASPITRSAFLTAIWNYFIRNHPAFIMRLTALPAVKTKHFMISFATAWLPSCFSPCQTIRTAVWNS